MLVFTIIVDRIENYAAEKAEHSHNNKKFLSRVNAELMMFGTVGLFLFCMKNVKDLPEDQDVLIEFVDILCSMGACGLIAMASVLLAVRHLNDWKFKELEAVNLIGQLVEPTGPVGSYGVTWAESFNASWLLPMDYQVMWKRFEAEHDLPSDFVYSDYLKNTLCNNACDLMDIKWYTWGVMLIISAAFLAVRVLNGTHFHNIVYITGFSVMNWSMLVFFCFLLWVINAKYAELVTLIRQDEQELNKAGVKMGHRFKKGGKFHSSPDTKAEEWSRRVEFAMQLLALLNSFLISFYFMHLMYNLQADDRPWWWRPLLLFPLMISLFVLLPLCTSRFTVTEAYLSPDSDALDQTLQEISQLEEDFDYIRRIWVTKDKPQFPALEEGVDIDGLAKVLREMKIHISKTRVHRIFKAMDTDKSGDVTAEELTKRLENVPEASGSLSAHTFSFRQNTFQPNDSSIPE